MRIALIICCAIIIVLITFLATTVQELKDNERSLKAEKKEAIQKADEALDEAKATRDSLEIAFATIRSLSEQTERARQETNAWRMKYQAVKIVRFKTDSERDSVLLALYPSIVKP